MGKFDKKSLLKFSPLLILSVILIIFAFVNPPLFKNENSVKVSTQKLVEKHSPEIKTATDSSGNNSVKVNLGNTASQTGTCTVTKNGVTTTVPAGSVNVNEKSSGDINVKVNCDSSTSSSTSNNTSINNNIDVKVNTSN